MADEFVGPPMPAPGDLGLNLPTPPPIVPSAPGLSSFLPQPNMAQKIGPLVAMALAAALGPKRGGAGVAQGYALGQQRVDQQDLQTAQIKEQDAIRQQQIAQQQANRQAAIDEQRQKALFGAMQTIKQRVDTIKDPKQYDTEIEAYSNLLQQNGFRVTPNQLRLNAPFVAPDAKKVASDAVSAWLKNPANDALLKKDPSVVGKVMLRIDTNGDGIPENVPLIRAGQLAGIQFAQDENGQFIGTMEADPKVGSAFQEVYKADLARFVADNKRQPDPKEKQGIVEGAIKKAKESGTITPGQQPEVMIKPGTNNYKVAQGLAEGSLTFAQFSKLFAYSRDAETRKAIYNLATELNPNFSPAGFEMGYRFASNPKTQNQVASINNVISGVPDLLKFSDEAKRSGLPVLNSLIRRGGFALGGRSYANFNTARTAFADELSGALGYGSATDMSREMGFDMTNPNLSPADFRSGMEDVVVPFVRRKKASLLGQMGPYAAMQQQGGPTDTSVPSAADSARKKLLER